MCYCSKIDIAKTLKFNKVCNRFFNFNKLCCWPKKDAFLCLFKLFLCLKKKNVFANVCLCIQVVLACKCQFNDLQKPIETHKISYNNRNVTLHCKISENNDFMFYMLQFPHTKLYIHIFMRYVIFAWAALIIRQIKNIHLLFWCWLFISPEKKKYECAIEQGSGGLWDNNTEILHTKIKKCAQVSTIGHFFRSFS